jgi:hypothetical protein
MDEDNRSTPENLMQGLCGFICTLLGALMLSAMCTRAQDDLDALKAAMQAGNLAGLEGLLQGAAPGNDDIMKQLEADDGVENVQIGAVESAGNKATVTATATRHGRRVRAMVKAEYGPDGWKFETSEWTDIGDAPTPSQSTSANSRSTALAGQRGETSSREGSGVNRRLGDMPNRRAKPAASAAAPPAQDSQNPLARNPPAAGQTQRLAEPAELTRDERVWVSSKGAKMVGTLIGYGDGKAIIRRSRDGKHLQLEVSRFSKKDQVYLQSLDRDEEPDAGGERTWTSRKGNKIVGRLVSFENGVAVIEKSADGGTLKIKREQFSQPDQDYLDSLW